MTDFDLDRYLRASAKLDVEGIAWDSVAEHPLRPDEARCLTYMMDIESHTVMYLRDLLATRSALEPDVTAFLSCWVYEELWHGEAFSRFLGAAGHPLPPYDEMVSAGAAYPSRQRRNAWIRRHIARGGAGAHLGTMVGSALVRDFAAVHMTWGAINELSTLTGYQRLIATTNHPVLVDLLRRIIRDERRHFAFYRAQARLRLGRSRQARRVTRWALQHLWTPVGTGVRPQAETDFVIATLFAGPQGLVAAREMDATIHALPGLEGLELITRARDRALRAQSPTAGDGHAPAATASAVPA